MRNSFQKERGRKRERNKTKRQRRRRNIEGGMSHTCNKRSPLKMLKYVL
jgi:hypothetical protein